MGLLVMVAVVVGDSQQAGALGTRDRQSTSGTNDGSTVYVDASDTQHVEATPARVARTRRRSVKRTDHRAVYRSLRDRMTVTSAREYALRAAEARLIRSLDQAAARCAANARLWERRSVRRVVVTTVTRVRERYTVRRLVPVKKRVEERYRQWYTTRENRTLATRIPTPLGVKTVRLQVPVTVRKWRWATRTVTRIALEWREVARTRIVEKPVRRVVTRRNPVAAAVAVGFRSCERSYRAARATQARRIVTRRARWDAEWAGLNRAAHAAWKRFNTACRTIGHHGGSAVQECGFAEWRNYSEASWTRTVAITPPKPPETIIQAAKDKAAPPSPVVNLNPSQDHEQIVHLPTWMWVDGRSWKPVTARAEAGQAWAEARAVPTGVIWDMGNGDTVVCRGPGTPYDTRRSAAHQSSDCTYTYERSSDGQPHDRYTVTATVVYDVDWTGSNGSGGSLGRIEKTASTTVRVAEIQALDT